MERPPQGKISCAAGMKKSFSQRHPGGEVFLRPVCFCPVIPAEAYEQPEVAPQVSHFMQVPLRTMVKLPHSPQASPS